MIHSNCVHDFVSSCPHSGLEFFSGGSCLIQCLSFSIFYPTTAGIHFPQPHEDLEYQKTKLHSNGDSNMSSEEVGKKRSQSKRKHVTDVNPLFNCKITYGNGR